VNDDVRIAERLPAADHDADRRRRMVLPAVRHRVTFPYPILCMVTSGRLSGNSTSHDASALLERIAAAAQAGVALVQIREPGLESRALAGVVAAAVSAVGGTAACVIVNDRLDVAIGAGAHGVHLKGTAMPSGRVRAVAARPFIVGRSVHDARTVMDGDVDYLVFGTVFASGSKPHGHPVAGVDALRAIAASAPVPVLAIGGMTVARLGEVRDAGAAGFAAIGLFAEMDVSALGDACRRARAAFDRPQPVS
jgi:thiamine-phosphate pyrophosphorylase